MNSKIEVEEKRDIHKLKGKYEKTMAQKMSKKKNEQRKRKRKGGKKIIMKKKLIIRKISLLG